eukprot:m51a1_g2381 hypothetical protein (428) ;mRNA; r:699449-700732
MRFRQRGVGALFVLTATAVVGCYVTASYLHPTQETRTLAAPPPAPRCTEAPSSCPGNGTTDEPVRPVIESHALEGHRCNVTFNPAVAGYITPLARCPPRPIVVLYRDLVHSPAGTLSSVSVHVWTPPATGFAGRLSECSPSPVVFLEAADELQQQHANASNAVRCNTRNMGYEDPRGLVLSDGTLLVFVNNIRPSDCKRRMAVLRAPLSEISSATAANCSGNRSIAIPSVTWLSYNERALREKNWVPFAEGPRSSLIVSYTLEPHLVLECPLHKGNSRCRKLASTSWPQLEKLVRSNGRPMRPSNVPVYRADHADYIAVGHFRQGQDVQFFFYTFHSSAPYSLKSASQPFHFDFKDRFQYLSGFSRIGDYYMATFSIHDNTTHTATWHHCNVDRLVQRFKPGPVGIVKPTKIAFGDLFHLSAIKNDQ